MLQRGAQVICRLTTEQIIIFSERNVHTALNVAYSSLSLFSRLRHSIKKYSESALLKRFTDR